MVIRKKLIYGKKLIKNLHMSLYNMGSQ